MRSEAPQGPKRRLGAVRSIAMLGFVVLAGRAAHLTLAYERSEGVQDGQVQTTLRLAGERGELVDRRGVELAVSVRAPSVYVFPSEWPAERRGAYARALAGALERPAERVLERLGDRRQFTFVARWIDEERAAAVEALDLPGVGLLREPRRAYPGGALAAPILGFANIDARGVRGIEQQEDDWLRGSERAVRVERDGSGRLLARPGVAALDTVGGDVALTLDACMQSDAESLLQAAVERTGARGGGVLTLDPHTGEILALAEAPSFDPNRFRQLDFAETRSRAFSDAVEPGSVMKVFLVAAGLEAGTLAPEHAIDTTGASLRVPGKTIRDRRDFGVLDPAGVLRVSSNVGAVRIAQDLGATPHHAALRRFGFGETTGSGFPLESAGLLRPPQRWQPVDHATVAFGQGIGVTAVQLAAATGALANGGEWLRPRLVAARRRERGPWERTGPERVRRAVAPETARAVLDMMQHVVTSDGTGRLAALDGVAVAGKTGTAQKLDPETGRYSDEAYIAWFVGVVPADAPRLVILVQLDEPQGELNGGGAVAAPLFADVAAAHLAPIGILTRSAPRPATPPAQAAEPEEHRLASADADGNPPAAEGVESGDEGTKRPVGRVAAPAVASPPAAASGAVEVVRIGDRLLLPDFRGLSVEEVMRITSKHAVELQLRGRGRAVEQEPLPGTILSGADARVWVRFAHNGKGEG